MTILGGGESSSELSAEQASALAAIHQTRADKSSPYHDPSHPDHQSAVDQMQAHYRTVYGDAIVSVVGPRDAATLEPQPAATAEALTWPTDPDGQTWDASFQRGLEGWDQHCRIPRVQTQALITLLPALLREAAAVDPDELREDSIAALTARHGTVGMARVLRQAEAELDALPASVSTPIINTPGLANSARVIEELSLRWEARARATGPRGPSIL